MWACLDTSTASITQALWQMQFTLLGQAEVEGSKEMKTAAIYCRVSTDNQEQEGTSLQTQLENCLSYCQDRGYDVAYRFSEAYSGLSLERPKLDELRDLVRNDRVDLVVVYCLDRLSRDPTHGVILIQEMEKHHAILESVTEDIDNSELGKLISYIRGFASKLEAEKIRERTIRGRRAKAIQGRISSGSHARLYGYNYIPVAQENGGRRVINEDEAKWVQQIYHWLIEEGLSTTAITLRLRALNVPTPSGKGYWIKSTVRKILRNVAYTGKTYAFTLSYGEPTYRMKQDTKRKKTGVIHKPEEEWIEIPDVTPVIIHRDIFDAARKQLQTNRAKASRNVKHEYLLRGHVFCRQCGGPYWGYVGSKHKGNKHYEARRYRCSRSQRIEMPVDRCHNKSWAADNLELLVWQQIERVLSEPELIIAEIDKQRQGASQQGVLETELQRIERQLKTLDRDQEQLLQWALKGFPEETVIIENKKINAKRVTLTEHKTELQAQVEASREAAISLPNLERFVELMQEKLSVLDYKAKRLALDMLNIKVWIDGHSVEITGTIPKVDDAIVTTQSGWHPPDRRPGS